MFPVERTFFQELTPRPRVQQGHRPLTALSPFTRPLPFLVPRVVPSPTLSPSRPVSTWLPVTHEPPAHSPECHWMWACIDTALAGEGDLGPCPGPGVGLPGSTWGLGSEWTLALQGGVLTTGPPGRFLQLIESESHSVVSDSSQPHGLHSPCNSPGQNTGVGSHSLLQG